MNDDEPEDYNKVTITFAFRPDKWVGLELWREKVNGLLSLASLLNLDYGRSDMEVTKEFVDAYEEREDWGDGV